MTIVGYNKEGYLESPGCPSYSNCSVKNVECSPYYGKGKSGYSGVSGWPVDFWGTPGNRIPEEEQEIILEGIPGKCFQYAQSVVQGRWPEGEKVIKREGYYWRPYLRYQIVDRHPSKEEQRKWALEEGFTPELLEIFLLLGEMPVEFQELVLCLRPDLVGQIPGLDSGLKAKYQHEVELSQVDL
jgi:hypothetical protein